MRTVILALPLFAACAADELTGTITSTAYGEEFLEEGIPTDAFDDGWSVAFDSFLVSIGDPKAKAGEGGPEIGEGGLYLVDLARPSKGEGYTLASYDAPEGRYDHYGYRLAPSSSATAINVKPADADAMKASGYSIWVRGTAKRDAETRTFDWGFTLSLAYTQCEMAVAIDASGGEVTMQSTIHADHFFYDDAVSPEPGLAFQLIADADGADGSARDGAITLAELAATDIRAEQRYQVGSNRAPDGSEITNLLQYIQYQATTLGHINGEGHCGDVIVMP
jgi:hypothetical protein